MRCWLLKQEQFKKIQFVTAQLNVALAFLV